MAEVLNTRKTAREPVSERQLESLRQIRTVGDPVLRERAQPVAAFDRDLKRLAKRMFAIMHDAPGVGLAATQIGVVRRLLVYEVDEQRRALVNPELTAASDERELGDEGCLSVPGVVVPVERDVRIRVRARDLSGRSLDFEAEGLEARVIQHEVDHLNGVLILDRTAKEERAKAMRALREAAAVGT